MTETTSVWPPYGYSDLMPIPVSDKSLITSCERLAAAVEEFHSPTNPYVVFEASGETGVELDQAAATHLRQYDQIVEMSSMLCRMAAMSSVGLGAKMKAAESFAAHQGPLCTGAGEDLRASVLRDLQALSSLAASPVPGVTHWLGRRGYDQAVPHVVAHG